MKIQNIVLHEVQKFNELSTLSIVMFGGFIPAITIIYQPVSIERLIQTGGRDYKPITEFLLCRICYWFSKFKSFAYTMSRNYDLVISLNPGKVILIGSEQKSNLAKI